MTAKIADSSPRVYARIAGFVYVLIIVIGVLKGVFVDTKLIEPGNDAATASNILTHELLFRFGFAGEMILFVLVVVLSLALFVILNPVNKNLALVALFLRFAEGIIGCVVTVLSGLIPLLLLPRQAGFATEQLQALLGLFLDIRTAGLDIILIFVGLGGAVFCYLFFTSKYVPRILAAWGIFTYVSMLFLAFINILAPTRPAMIENVLFALGGLFEVLFGCWLMVKGVNVQQGDVRASEQM